MDTVRQYVNHLRSEASEGSEGSSGGGIRRMLSEIEKHGSTSNTGLVAIAYLVSKWVTDENDRQEAEVSIEAIAKANQQLQVLKYQLARTSARLNW